MKNLNESIREKLTAKYIEKASKVLKIAENLERVSKDFYDENYDKFFNRMFKLSESFRKSSLYINESTEGNFDIAFTKLFKGDENKVKDKLTDYVSSQLKLTKDMKDNLKNQMESIDLSEISKFFSNPDKMVDMVANSVIDCVKNPESEEDIFSIVQGVSIPYFNTVDFKETLKKKLKSKVSEKVDVVKGNVEKMVRDIMKSVAEKSSKS
jgi:hypothetical protein